MGKMKILITGATGFVGINVALALSKAYEVRIFARNQKKAARLFNGAVDISFGDILNLESLKKSMQGIDCIVNIAGLIKSFDTANLYNVNVGGVRNVALAAKETGVHNIIHLSSLAARGPDNSDGPVSHYGYSKLLGEYEFMKYMCEFNLKIIRPPIIYGEYEREFFRLFKMAKLGILPVLKDKLFSFVYVQDLVHAIEKLINFDAKKPEIYYISDGNKYTWQEVADAMFDVVGNEKMRLRLNLSPKFASLIAYLTYYMKDKAPFTLDKINEIKASGWSCGFEKLKNDLNFEPEYAIRSGFEKTLRWYEKNGWL